MHRTPLEKRRPPSPEGGRTIASILCPIDFSDESLAALRRSVEIAAWSGARLAALHVADDLLVHAAAACHAAAVVEKSERALRQAVDQVRGETGTGGLDVAVHVVVGDPAREICRFSRQHDVDLIVMASHQSNQYRRRLVGSVADCVLRRAAAPVLVFPTDVCTPASTVCVVRRPDDRAAVAGDGWPRAGPEQRKD